MNAARPANGPATTAGEYLRLLTRQAAIQLVAPAHKQQRTDEHRHAGGDFQQAEQLPVRIECRSAPLSRYRFTT